MATSPVAVIGFSGAASPLEAAWPSTHRALLPVAAKPLIVYLVEQLARGGIRHLRIAGSIQQVAVRRRLGDGREWGVTIRYSDLHDSDLRTQTLLERGDCLYLAGDQFHVADFSVAADPEAFQPADLEARHARAAHWVAGPGGAARCALASLPAAGYRNEPLLTVAGFHAAGLDAAAGRAGAITPPGRALRPGVTVDWDTRLARDVVLGEPVLVGKHCRLGRGVRLEGDCVVGHGSVISRGSRLLNVTVLPNTYLGPGTRLRDAVVAPQGAFALDGAFLPSPDPAVIGRARGNAEARTGIPTEKLSVMEARWRATPLSARPDTRPPLT